MDEGGTPTNGLDDEKVDDDAQALHPRDDTGRLYVSRKGGQRVIY